MVISFLGLSILLVSGRLMQLSRHPFFTSAVSLRDLIQIVVFLLPIMTLYIMPMATLLGTLFAFLRLSSDNELTAIWNAGVSFKQLWPAVFSVALVATFVSFYSSIALLPIANCAFRAKLKAFEKKIAPAILQAGSFIDVVPNFVFFFQRVDQADLSAEGVFVRHGKPGNPGIAILAERLQLVPGRLPDQQYIKISNGTITGSIHEDDNDRNLSFGTYYIPLFRKGGGKKATGKKREEMTLSELYRGYSETGNRKMALEFHRRIALSAACFFLALVAAPLGVVFKSGSRMHGLVLALIVLLAYYATLAMGSAAAESGFMTPAAGIWLPNALLLFGAAFLWIRIDRGIHHPLSAIWKKT